MTMRALLLHLSRLMTCAALLSAAVALAGPWTQEELLQSNKRLRVTEGVIPCSVGESRVIILFDDAGTAAALVADEASKDVRRLARSIELGETRESVSGNCLVLLRESDASKPLSRLADNTPLQAIAFLLDSDFYTPTALQTDGRVLWATGKRQSVDLLLPLTGKDRIGGAELKTDMELTDFAGNVLARKLGYEKGSDNAAAKTAAAGKLRAERVYYCHKHDHAYLAAIGGHAFFFEGNRDTLQALTQKREELSFPGISAELKRPAPPAPASEETPQAHKMTPKEALRAFIDRLNKL